MSSGSGGGGGGLWDSVKATASKAGTAAKIAGTKTKLRAEMTLLDREMKARQHRFGVEMYDHLSPMTESPEFFAADDELTNTIRPSMLSAQREIKALHLKRGKLKEDIHQQQATRAGAFPTKAETWGGKVKNAAKSTSMAGTEAKLKTELMMVEHQMKAFKQQFGVELFAIMSDKEEREGWLPNDRMIRSIYDTTRVDIEKLRAKRADKEATLAKMGTRGGGGAGRSDGDEGEGGGGDMASPPGTPSWVNHQGSGSTSQAGDEGESNINTNRPNQPTFRESLQNAVYFSSSPAKAMTSSSNFFKPNGAGGPYGPGFSAPSVSSTSGTTARMGPMSTNAAATNAAATTTTMSDADDLLLSI